MRDVAQRDCRFARGGNAEVIATGNSGTDSNPSGARGFAVAYADASTR